MNGVGLDVEIKLVTDPEPVEWKKNGRDAAVSGRVGEKTSS